MNLEELHFDNGELKASAPPDHFAVFGLPRTLNLDEAELEQDFFALSRRFHPDFFVTKSADQQILSLKKTSALNNAYRVLKNKISRAEYLIELETGVAFGESGEAKQVPTELLSDVMEIRERIMDFDGEDSQRAALQRDKIWAQQKQSETDTEINRIAEGWNDATKADLISDLKDALSERRYFSGLIRDLGKASD